VSDRDSLGSEWDEFDHAYNRRREATTREEQAYWNRVMGETAERLGLVEGKMSANEDQNRNIDDVFNRWKALEIQHSTANVGTVPVDGAFIRELALDIMGICHAVKPELSFDGSPFRTPGATGPAAAAPANVGQFGGVVQAVPAPGQTTGPSAPAPGTVEALGQVPGPATGTGVATPAPGQPATVTPDQTNAALLALADAVKGLRDDLKRSREPELVDMQTGNASPSTGEGSTPPPQNGQGS
jgi:hypothetical protein